MPKSIIMIHGMWAGDWSWDNYKTLFQEKGYDCFTPVLRYHDAQPGAAPDSNVGKLSILDYVDDIESYINNLGLKEKPIILGHSMGGLIAQILAGRGLAEKLVLLATAAPRGINALKISIIRSMLPIFVRWGFWKKPQRISFRAAQYAIMQLLPEENHQQLYDRLVYDSGRVISEMGLWLFDFKKATKVDESKVNCPVLILYGTEDRITPLSLARNVAKKYQHVATYKEFENHGHMLNAEPGWEKIAGYILEWVDGN